MSDGTAVGLVKAEQLAEEMRQWKEQAEERRWVGAVGLQSGPGRGARAKFGSRITGRHSACPYDATPVSHCSHPDYSLHIHEPPTFIFCRRNAEGRGAQTVYRDKATGKVMTADEALKAKVRAGGQGGLLGGCIARQCSGSVMCPSRSRRAQCHTQCRVSKACHSTVAAPMVQHVMRDARRIPHGVTSRVA